VTWEEFCKNNKIGKRFHDVSWDNFPCEMHGYDFLSNVIFYGGPGRGKTYNSLAIIRVLLEAYKEVRWIQATEFEDQLYESKRNYGETKTLINMFSDCEFLFIDDFGTETTNEGLEREWYKLINNRWSDAKQTVFTTNLDPDEICKKYGERIFSRFKDFEWIEFEGEDLRGKK
tara:strand:+ start:1734 stop:2252 length:519 start_codon:yes stop_codon:yes gene_type:complete